jgi:ribosomal protein L16 Arg81 hydroxylase
VVVVQPEFFPKFINTSVFNFKELHNLLKKHPQEDIEIIYNNKKYRPYVKKLLDYRSSLIFSHSAHVKEIFSSLKKVFELKFPQIKKASKWDVHVYSSYSGEATSFKIHSDLADNIILQTEGLSKWHLPDYFDKTLTTGDMLWIPKGVKHGCKPLNRRISLSFAFWYF